MIKVALVGLGEMGTCHYNAYKKVNGAEVVAILDTNPEAAATRRGEGDTPIYTSFDELLSKHEIDMVDVCTPTDTHTEISIKALEKGFHLLCEKPMSITHKEASKITKTAQKSGKLCMVAHVVRFMAPYVYLKNIVKSGELGKVISIHMKRLSAVPRWSIDSWLNDPKRTGGVGLDLSIHDLDFCRFAFGEPKKTSSVRRAVRGDNDYIVSTLMYDDFCATIEGGWYEYDLTFTAEFVTIFEKGAVILQGNKLTKNGEEVNLDDFSYQTNTGITLNGKDGYADEIQYFVSCIEKGIAPDIVTAQNGEDSVRMAKNIIKKATVL